MRRLTEADLARFREEIQRMTNKYLEQIKHFASEIEKEYPAIKIIVPKSIPVIVLNKEANDE